MPAQHPDLPGEGPTEKEGHEACEDCLFLPLYSRKNWVEQDTTFKGEDDLA